MDNLKKLFGLVAGVLAVTVENVDENYLFYVHIPHCHTQCLYCTCHVEITKDYNQVKRYLDVFNGKEILFIEYEDLKMDVLGIVKKTYLFLGINQAYEPDINKKHNIK